MSQEHMTVPAEAGSLPAINLAETAPVRAEGSVPDLSGGTALHRWQTDEAIWKLAAKVAASS